jgi:hypothetical protein
MYKPDGREAAMLLLRAIKERGERRGKPMTRARLSRVTLKRLWNREQLTEQWLDEVNEWLLSAGWTLVFAGRTFGAVKTDIVENWPRIASKNLADVIDDVKQGSFDFSRLEDLLKSEQPLGQADQELDGDGEQANQSRSLTSRRWGTRPRSKGAASS